MLPGFVRRFLERRRFPTLMLIAAAVLIGNLFVPDPLPFVDEVLMLIATIVIGSFRERERRDRDSAS
jgi:uncharacterized membrane protein YccC